MSAPEDQDAFERVADEITSDRPELLIPGFVRDVIGEQLTPWQELILITPKPPGLYERTDTP